MKARLIIWGLVTTAFAVIVYQNQAYYLSKQTLTLNLFTPIHIPPVTNMIHVLVYFLAGLLLASISLYRERYKLRRQIKKLDTAYSSCAVEVATIKTAKKAQAVPITSKWMHRFRKKRVDSELKRPDATESNVASD